MNKIIKLTQESLEINNLSLLEDIYNEIVQKANIIKIRKKVLKRAIQNDDIQKRVDEEYVVICAVSLGLDIDKLIKSKSEESTYYGYIMDNMASFFVEEVLNELSQNKVFCLGYNGTDLKGNIELAKLISSTKFGIIVNESGTILPRKTIIGFEYNKEFSCENCVKLVDCKRKIKCYE
jgi:hypothetical protein